MATSLPYGAFNGFDDRQRILSEMGAYYDLLSPIVEMEMTWSNGETTGSSGFITSFNHVVTTAHSVSNRDDGAQLESITFRGAVVAVGEVDGLSTEIAGGWEVPNAGLFDEFSVSINPNYDSTKGGNDEAIITLDFPIVYFTAFGDKPLHHLVMDSRDPNAVLAAPDSWGVSISTIGYPAAAFFGAASYSDLVVEDRNSAFST